MFATVSFVFLLYWAVNWSKKDWPNVIMKFSFTLMTVWAGFEALTYWGYMIHV